MEPKKPQKIVMEEKTLQDEHVKKGAPLEPKKLEQKKAQKIVI
jgi:hypothetical protein